jgi:hypothetical protein
MVSVQIQYEYPRRWDSNTNKLKEEGNYRAVLKNTHYSINPEEIKIEIEKLGHKATNICNTEYNTIQN